MLQNTDERYTEEGDLVFDNFVWEQKRYQTNICFVEECNTSKNYLVKDFINVKCPASVTSALFVLSVTFPIERIKSGLCSLLTWKMEICHNAGLVLLF